MLKAKKTSLLNLVLCLAIFLASFPTPALTQQPPCATCGWTSEFCGNGVVEAGETCDDGNKIDYDSCRNSCMGSCFGPTLSARTDVRFQVADSNPIMLCGLSFPSCNGACNNSEVCYLDIFGCMCKGITDCEDAAISDCRDGRCTSGQACTSGFPSAMVVGNGNTSCMCVTCTSSSGGSGTSSGGGAMCEDIVPVGAMPIACMPGTCMPGYTCVSNDIMCECKRVCGSIIPGTMAVLCDQGVCIDGNNDPIDDQECVFEMATVPGGMNTCGCKTTPPAAMCDMSNFPTCTATCPDNKVCISMDGDCICADLPLSCMANEQNDCTLEVYNACGHRFGETGINSFDNNIMFYIMANQDIINTNLADLAIIFMVVNCPLLAFGTNIYTDPVVEGFLMSAAAPPSIMGQSCAVLQNVSITALPGLCPIGCNSRVTAIKNAQDEITSLTAYKTGVDMLFNGSGTAPYDYANRQALIDVLNTSLMNGMIDDFNDHFTMTLSYTTGGSYVAGNQSYKFLAFDMCKGVNLSTINLEHFFVTGPSSLPPSPITQSCYTLTLMAPPVNFTCTNLTDGMFVGTQFASGTTSITGAIFEGAMLNNANFDSANLKAAKLDNPNVMPLQTDISNTSFKSTDLNIARFNDVKWTVDPEFGSTTTTTGYNTSVNMLMCNSNALWMIMKPDDATLNVKWPGSPTLNGNKPSCAPVPN